jgi:predicted DNA-binding transcriptional regulator AlpA
MSQTSSGSAPHQLLGDVKRVAAVTNMNWRTVYRYADAGLMPWGLKIGNLRRWNMAEIQNWISEGCKPVRRANGGGR